MDALSEIVHREVTSYTGKGLNGYSYLVAGTDPIAWVVVTVARVEGKRVVSADMIVRLLDDQVIIERDDNDPPLVDALLQAGIPRAQIILAYAGEPVPESA